MDLEQAINPRGVAMCRSQLIAQSVSDLRILL